MIAVAPYHLRCTVYLYPSEAAARDGAAAGGSGFLASMDSGAWRHSVLVTNAHVLNHGNRVVRFNTKDGGADVAHTQAEDWVISSEDDLAVLPFNPPTGVEWSSIDTRQFLSEDCLIEGWELFPGDPVFFFGRFVGDDGRPRNAPVMRVGSIAMLADAHAPVTLEEGQQQVAFLVESRSMSGFSGSPSFVHLADSRLMDPDKPGAGYIPSDRVRLLGLVCAHLPFWSPVREKKHRGTHYPEMWVETNSGVSVVVPAWKILTLLNDERMVATRVKAEQRAERQRDTDSSS
jgi:hypothetical protein